MNFLPWSRFLITVSSPACIGNKNHFRRHRDHILIGSLVNSKQVNGRTLQKDTFTARLLLYVYVGYPSGMVSGKSGVDMSTPVHPVVTPLGVGRECNLAYHSNCTTLVVVELGSVLI